MARAASGPFGWRCRGWRSTPPRPRRLRLVSVRLGRRGRRAGRDHRAADRVHGACLGLDARGLRQAAGGPCSITPPHTELGLAAWRTLPRRRGAPLRPRRAVLGPAPGPRPATRSAPGRSGTSRTRPASFSRGPTSVATRACSAPRRTRSAARTRTPRSSSAGCSATRSAAARAGSRRPTTCATLRPPGPRGGVRRRRHPPVRRARALGHQAGRAHGHTRARGRRRAGRDLDHRDRLGLGRQAQPAESRSARQARGSRGAFRLLRPRTRAARDPAVLWYAWRDVPTAESRCKWCAHSGLFRAGSLVPKLAWDSFVRFTGGA